MKRVTLLLVVIAVQLGMAPRAALAWGETGHEVVAQIAYWRLGETSSPALARVNAALGHLRWDDLVTQPRRETDGVYRRYADDPLLARWAVASILPDMIRRSHRIRRGQNPNLPEDPRDGWHYVDWPIHAGYRGPDPSGPSALTAIAELVPSLREGRGTPAEQAIHLAFLIHVIGDLHQPLHCATRYTKQIQTPNGQTIAEKHGDRGGNSFTIKAVRLPNGGSDITKLHAYWDLLPELNASRLTPSQLAVSLTRQWPVSSLTAELAETDLAQWSKQGTADAQQHVYTRDIVQTRDTRRGAYSDNAWGVAKKRLALAGYRLAAKLNEIYSR